jgi:hypothetical protein
MRRKPVDRRVQIVSNRTAHAPVAQQRQREIASARYDDRAVDIDFSGLIDDDGGVPGIRQ